MNSDELIKWLFDEGVKPELEKLIRLTVTMEIDNLNTDGFDQKECLDGIDWDRVLLAGSILSRSSQRIYHEAALRIATAAVTLETSQYVRDGGAVLLEKLSNHRAVLLAEQKDRLEPELESRLGVSMRLEAQRRRMKNSILVESTGNWLEVNNFQRDFWNGATNNLNWLSASAPTASGKTFLVLQWLLDRMNEDESQVAVYLAPTRALVTEIETSLRELLKGRDDIILSSLPLRENFGASKEKSKKLIYVFTQERLHLLINFLDQELRVDLLVVDEAHKVGDNQRGVVLQDAVERVSRDNENIKVVFISPSTQNPGELLQDAPKESNTKSVDSDVPTVLQNVIVAEQVPRKPQEWKLTLRNGGSEIYLGDLQLANKPSGLRKRLAFIAAAAGERGGTLVYTNGAAEAEKVALLISQLIPSHEGPDQELLALADLIRKGVHSKYQLAPLVERGVAFHYGNMPAVIRLEVERLFREGKIRFLACTSTLIEGVNLSCRTIVVRGPRKGMGNFMEPHDFWNLAGRAGRWGDEFQGNIICIDPNDANAWPDGVPKRARYKIHRETDALLERVTEMAEFLAQRKSVSVPKVEDVEQFEQVSGYLLNTYLRLGSISKATFAKRHKPEELERLDGLIQELVDDIDITAEIAIRHPGVSVIGLQSLLNQFRAYEGDIENLLPAPTESVDAYDRFTTIMRRINECIFPVFKPDGLVPLHALIVMEWLKGLSLAAIIRRRIKYQEDHNKTYNLPMLIRSTMEIVEQTARFRAPKYFSAYIDILKLHLRESKRDDLIDTNLDIAVALEFGVSSITLLSLMELGLSRMSAVALYEIIAKDDLDLDACISWIAKREEEFEGIGIPMLLAREIREKVLTDASVRPVEMN